MRSCTHILQQFLSTNMPDITPVTSKSTPSTPPTRRWILLTIILFIAITTLIWFGLRLNVTWNPRAQFTDAQTRWQSASITDYQMTVHVQIPFMANDIYRFTVSGDAISNAQSINPRAYQFDPNPPTFEVMPEDVVMYTVDAWLLQAQRLSADLEQLHFYTRTSNHIIYDPTYGYVQRYVKNTCGWLLTVAPECMTTYEVLDWQPINTDTK